MSLFAYADFIIKSARKPKINWKDCKNWHLNVGNDIHNNVDVHC